MVKMLDLAGLPKNTNGFRTTHTCELCGFEPKTKNKYREKQDHLVMKHFKEKIDKIFPHCRPYQCPASPQCVFVGKDKQALLRHYTGKHGILEQFLKEALLEMGIPYNPQDAPYKTKRKNSTESKRAAKVQALDATKAMLPSVPLRSDALAPATLVTTPLTQNPNPVKNEDLQREVDVMIACLKPQPQAAPSSGQGTGPLLVTLPQVPTAPNLVSSGGVVTTTTTVNPTAPRGNPAMGPMTISLPTVPITQAAVSMSSSMPKLITPPTPLGQAATPALPSNPLPPTSFVLPQHPVPQYGSDDQSGPLPSITTLPSIIKTTTLLRRSPQPPMSRGPPMPELILPHNSQNCSQQQHHHIAPHHHQQSLSTVMTIPKAANYKGGMVPMAIDGIARNSVASDPGSSTPPSSIAMDDPSEMNADQNTVVLENEEVMWSAPMDGPAVVVEVADTVPVTYISDGATMGQMTMVCQPGQEQYATQLDNMEYDYLQTSNVNSGSVNHQMGGGVFLDTAGVRHRQLDFAML